MPRVRAQHEIPTEWPNLWRVGADIECDPMAHRICEVVGYERDKRGESVVRVRYLERYDLFEPEEGVYTPWQLFPVQGHERI